MNKNVLDQAWWKSCPVVLINIGFDAIFFTSRVSKEHPYVFLCVSFRYIRIKVCWVGVESKPLQIHEKQHVKQMKVYNFPKCISNLESCFNPISICENMTFESQLLNAYNTQERSCDCFVGFHYVEAVSLYLSIPFMFILSCSVVVLHFENLTFWSVSKVTWAPRFSNICNQVLGIICTCMWYRG